MMKKIEMKRKRKAKTEKQRTTIGYIVYVLRFQFSALGLLFSWEQVLSLL